MKAFRYGLVLTGYKLDDRMTEWLAECRDTVSFEHFCRPSIWRKRWLNEKTYQSKTVDEVWESYQGSFYQKTDRIVNWILDRKDRLLYLLSRVPYRLKKLGKG